MSQRKKTGILPILIISVVCVMIAVGTILVLLALGFFGIGEGVYIPFVSAKKIAVIDVIGTLYESDDIISQLKRHRKNGSVGAIILHIESPGGTVGASQEIYQEILRTREEYDLPVFASLGGIAASGGYYIASACEKIYANPGTITGSIGVILNFPNMEELFSKIGLRFTVIKTGEYKDIGSSFREMTEEEKTILQDMIDDVFDQFVEAVVDGRLEAIGEILSLPKDAENKKALVTEKVYELADGRVFSGRQALDYGLVDELGTLEDVIWAVADEIGIKGEPSVIRFEEPKSILEGIFGKDSIRIFDDNPTIQYVWR